AGHARRIPRYGRGRNDRRARGDRQRGRGRAGAAGDRGRGAAGEPRAALPAPRGAGGGKEMNLGLAGKVALVTGGARDVGREISLTLAGEGAAVAVNYMHSKAEAESLVAEITKLGGRAAAYQADVADYATVGRMIDQIVAELGRLDVVVNNAGYVEAKLFLETKPEEWKRQVDVDLYGVFNVCHAAAPKLAAQKGGRIISIVGDSARVGQQRLGVSAGARGAVLSVTRTLAKELGRFNITVNALALGW